MVNVSSRAGMLKYIVDEEVRNQLKSADLSVEDIDKLVERYIE